MTSFMAGKKVRAFALTVGLASIIGVASAQDPQTRGWRKVTDPAPVDQTPPAAEAPEQNAVPPQSPAYPSSFPDSDAASQQRSQQKYQYPPPGYQPGYQNATQQQMAAVPAQLNLRAGTFVSVRVNNPLSSDHNQQGDAFTATLARPIVVDGIVVALAGQTIAGRISEAQKAGRLSGTSKLGLQLTELTLVDGTQVPLQSGLLTRNGRTSVGSDVGAIGATTAVGAAIGAAADWGRGAAIGAGAGAAAGILGVLLTRGQATVVYPETLLTFRVDAPVTISTDRAPQAFRFADSGDYQRVLQPRTGPPARVAYGRGPYYPGPYYGPSNFWGPSFGVYVGPRYRYYGRRW